MTNAINSVAGVDDFATMVKDLMAERDKLEADLAAAQKTLNDHLLSEAAETMRADKATSELAAARALLREAYVAMREPTGEWHDIKCNTVLPKIHAALAEGKK